MLPKCCPTLNKHFLLKKFFSKSVSHVSKYKKVTLVTGGGLIWWRPMCLHHIYFFVMISSTSWLPGNKAYLEKKKRNVCNTENTAKYTVWWKEKIFCFVLGRGKKILFLKTGLHHLKKKISNLRGFYLSSEATCLEQQIKCTKKLSFIFQVQWHNLCTGAFFKSHCPFFLMFMGFFLTNFCSDTQTNKNLN